ncbi:MAG: ubiquinol-cytochrome c reductase iron-sulfur subunit [Candidatus Aminicenantales bacterium]
MKLRYSLFTRRQFLNGLIGGWLAALAASFISPVLKFIFPPYKEPEEVILPLSNFQDMKPNSARTFFWGNKPGILKMRNDRSYQAFVGVCTHLDCNVQYLPQKRKFFCACHEGWYDENGINIAGPPPRPLRQLRVAVEEENLVIRRNETG